MTKIKICGIRTLHDAWMAAEAGADMLGFNFHPGSVRYIEPETCSGIAAAVHQAYPSVQLVGVFVNSPVEYIGRVLAACTLDFAQLSGDESPEVCAALGGIAFKAFHGVPEHQIGQYARREAPAFLVDGHANGAYGGTGITADWSAAARLAREYPLLLAGGLKPENVAEAVEQVRPWGVDVASGVESQPGKKDAGRIKAFIEAVQCVEVQAQ